jgi:anti-anti-sigma factor
MSSRQWRPSLAVVSAHGDIDAANADSVTRYALHESTGCRALILDLLDVNFFAAEGFSALHRIAVNCARHTTVLTIVPGAFASRVLGICDPDGSLPCAETIITALRPWTDEGHDRPRLTTSAADTVQPSPESRCPEWQ